MTTEFNSCRAASYNAFRITLAEAMKNSHVTEIQFRDAWLARLQEDKTLYASGWYDPPPHGIAVLFASDKDPNRISFESLRQAKFWPGNHVADWKGFIFAYSSCVSRDTGIIGDFDVTLYLGNNAAFKEHYRNCYFATDALLQSISLQDTSKTVFKRSEEIFSNAGLRNCVMSITDATPLDLGHTYPTLPRDQLLLPPQQMELEQRNLLRTGRKFINNVTDWPLHEGIQFSIEPQLRSINYPDLPQISFHYLLSMQNGALHICRDIDELIKSLIS